MSNLSSIDKMGHKLCFIPVRLDKKPAYLTPWVCLFGSLGGRALMSTNTTAITSDVSGQT